jgi:hypothetical protein
LGKLEAVLQIRDELIPDPGSGLNFIPDPDPGSYYIRKKGKFLKLLPKLF